jgi:AraC-like DNA-binding protein
MADNVTMSFQGYTPAYPLNRFVRYFYSPTGRMPYREEKVLPSPQTDLKINFGGRFVARRADGEASLVDPRGWFMGVWDQYHTVVWPDDPDFIGVAFWPGGAHALMGIDMDAVHNQFVPLEAIWGGFADELRERLYEAGGAQARFALLERLLTARIDRTAKFEKIAPALKALQSGQAVERGFSHKHLISLFNSVVGVPPKRLARLHRIQEVIDAVEQARPISWTAVAQDFLFADQAHFNKEFKFFTGHTPGDYLNRRRRVVMEAPEHAVHTRLLPTA